MTQYSPIALLVTVVWIPVLLYFFIRFPPQRALVVSVVVGWLYLPVIEFPLPGIPDITKMNATCYGILLATVIFDSGRLTSFRPGWVDLPMLIWCFCPFASSITNDLSAYDGFSASLEQAMTWGVPYFLGRVYLNNMAGLRQLAVGIFVGGLTYVPLCLLEGRISPQLHRWVYGYHASQDFTQAMRLGGYRPTVFMNHGLAVGAWMMAATLCGIWLWKTGAVKELWNTPINQLVIVLIITFILCRSTGAYLLLVMGLAMLFAGNWLRTALPLLLLILGISTYLYVGVNGTVNINQIYGVALQMNGPERAQSLKFRLDNEEMLSKKARQRMMFGWGGYGRNRVYETNWEGERIDISVTDSLWIIAFGVNGLVGLVSITASLLLPAASLVLLRYPARTWSHPKAAPGAVLAVIVTLYMLDCVLNAMTNPIFALASGAMAGAVLEEKKTNQVRGTPSTVPRRSLAQPRQNQPG
ncbi:MAG TPA: O-antigen ligase domain-containing protein [Coleofasciculaceae cyanobacterium]